MPPKKDADAAEGAPSGPSALEKDLELIGGKDLVLARMELGTTLTNLKEKIKENKSYAINVTGVSQQWMRRITFWIPIWISQVVRHGF